MKNKIFCFIIAVLIQFVGVVKANEHVKLDIKNNLAKIQQGLNFVTGKRDNIKWTENINRTWKYKFKNADGKFVWIVLGYKRVVGLFYTTITESIEFIDVISDTEQDAYEIGSKVTLPTARGLFFMFML